MDRRTFIAGIGAALVAPAVAWADITPTPTFDNAVRYQFRKDLSICVKSHLPSLSLLNAAHEQQFFIEGVTKFMKASSAKGTIVDPWSIVVLDDEGVAYINYQLKTSPHQEDRLTVHFNEHPVPAVLEFFPEKS